MRSLFGLSGLAVVAVVVACGGIDRGKVTLNTDAGGVIQQSDGGLGDAGDGGGDAGVDAGFDGGCIHGDLATTANDFGGCFGAAGSQTATVFEGTQGFCSAVIILGGGGRCDGVFSGPNNSFDGGCTGHSPCTAPSIPGVISCSGGCQIKICDGGATCP